MGASTQARRALPAVVLLLAGCGDGDSRGSTMPSWDGGTYLAIVEDHSTTCRAIVVDGRPWAYALGAPVPVAPGAHRIRCGGEFEVVVPKGVVYRIDDWDR